MSASVYREMLVPSVGASQKEMILCVLCIHTPTAQLKASIVTKVKLAPLL